ncbi:MAG: polymer-forming cytoskeletal protein [Patescibacteria group bacterium]|nr:polymer-forming cytoskeletal protein [Patescibacteria group bacterium]MDD5715515.1 polymer-forming cytoskeletal protein [Patescibacteria group bacterium]
MALFSNQTEGSSETETIIGPSVKVEGNFKSEGNISVNGFVQGSITTSADLRVGQNAKIKAEVAAKNLFLQGEIRGNVIVSDKAQLSSTAKVLGNITTKILSVEEGAVINGKCTMLHEQQESENKSEVKRNGK